ncbi:MAG: hypothetical protein JNL13_04965 [Chitinophagaceae bacterium]|nr:hypothetical protein [Chitinophagaceae bacterium]
MKTLFPIVVLIVLCSWQQPSDSGVQPANWLRGSWVYHGARGPVYECWTRVSDTGLSGKSFMLKSGDTVVLESIYLLSEQGTLYYIPAVTRQNRGLPVRFTAKAVSPGKLVFENPAHDFPQCISYTLITPDSLLAEISGTRNGTAQRKLFPMKRVQE